MSNAICKSSTDAESYWREQSKCVGIEPSAWVLSLDAERRLIGCDPVAFRFYAQPVLLADETLIMAMKRGAKEFIFIHYRPGFSPKSNLGCKERARALILAGRMKDCSCLDYMIVGDPNEKFIRGIFSLSHFKSFHTDDPFLPKAGRKPRQASAQPK